MTEAGMKPNDAEAMKEAAELLAGNDAILEDDVKMPEPMEDIKTSAKDTSKHEHKSASPEFEKFFAPLNKAKEDARGCHKNGKYDDAIDKYKSCLKLLEKLKSSNKIGVPNEEFYTQEAHLNNNIAVCFKQKQETTPVITYATKVIDSPVTDPAVKLKAYTLRAYAYEGIDKVKLAKEDWTKVKEMQSDNTDATKALTRIQQAIQKDDAQRKMDSVGEALRGLEEFKKKGNEFYKNSKLSILYSRGLHKCNKRILRRHRHFQTQC